MKKRYYARGLFCCTSCNHEEELSSGTEFLQLYSRETCNECGSFSFEKFQLAALYINDDIPGQREMRWGMLKNEVGGCTHCNPVKAVEWIKVLVECPQCQNGFMQFKHFTEYGKQTILQKQQLRIKMLKQVDFSAWEKRMQL